MESDESENDKLQRMGGKNDNYIKWFTRKVTISFLSAFFCVKKKCDQKKDC